MPLPILKQGIFDSFSHYIDTEMKKPGSIERLVDELGEKDELMVIFIERIVSAIMPIRDLVTPDQAAVLSAIMVYKVLESQQSANDLADQIE